MQFRKGFVAAHLLLVVFTLCIVSWVSTVQAVDCTVTAFQALGLKDEKFSKPVTIESAAIVPATATVPEYCDVIGVMSPTIRFEVALPTTTATTKWNERLLMAGNGGKAGIISKTGTLVPSGAIIPAVQLGYAATSTDTGHCSADRSTNPTGGCPVGTQIFPGSTFAYVDYPSPGANPDWYQKLEDFAYRSVHETIVVAKKMVQAYYNKAPLYTYWVGCSQGGRQGLIAAQRYPNDFNGITDGSAVNAYMAQQMSGPEQLQPQYSTGCDITGWCGGPQIPLAKLPVLGAAVFAKCDDIDGLVDGLIDDPRKCNFDPNKDLVKCPGDVDGPACFTSAQVGALKKIYAGGFTSKGKLVVPRVLPSAEAMPAGWSPWLVGNSLKGTQKYGVVGDAFQYIVFETPRPNFEVLRDWNWDTDPQLTVERGNLLDATDPNLSAFYAHKGKLLMFQGFADMSSNPLANSFAYYENVVKVMPQSRDFVAYYMVPGMGHCSGGIGCDKVDWFTPMVNWVEKGIEPGALIGATSTGTPRTRPICRYPEVARYSGSGSIDDAASFMCVPPVEVRLEPETLNLKSKDVFTAFITMPRGFDVRDWHIHDVTCEGASAVKGMAFREGYIATFRTRDLKEVSLEKAVVLTVKLAFYHDGKDALTQGSDTVRVIREDRDRGHEEWGHNDHHNRGKVALEWER